MIFQLGRHGIIPAVKVTEQGHRCDQFYNLAFIKIVSQFIKIFPILYANRGVSGALLDAN
jgi:hypothetical protein